MPLAVAGRSTGPLRRWVGSQIEVDHAMAIMSQDQQPIQDLEADSRNGEKIDRDDLREMVFQKGSPVLRRRFAAADHVLGDVTFADIDAEHPAAAKL